MSFYWKDYLDLAHKLINDSQSDTLEEAYLRSSVSRSYYSIFCLARNFLENNKGKTFGKYDIHKEVRNEFINSADISEQMVGQILFDLRTDRNDADYDDSYSITFQSADNIHNLANTAYGHLKLLDPNI